jgi:hypothetical protein
MNYKKEERNQSGVVAPIFNPSYFGGGSRITAVQGQPGK